MQPDLELETWRRQWQARETVPPDLTRRVERELRHARRAQLLAIGVTIGFGVAVPVRASLTGRPDDVVLAIGVWVFIVLAWVVSWRIMRGDSKPAAATTTAFLDFSILSCRRHLTEVGAAAMLYAVFLTFIMWLQYREFAAQTGAGPWAFVTRTHSLVVWAVTAALGGFAWWRRQLLRRELRNLMSIQKSYQYSTNASSTKQ
ncbi:MAG TPA: hypothetical protein VES67_21795 [Vicinamibacterales bacterium]|nr:hypothetical protein [Vicinamibacterales bacterium]